MKKKRKKITPLEKYRKLSFLSGPQLAKLSKISPQTIWDIEKGVKRKYRENTLIPIFNVLESRIQNLKRISQLFPKTGGK